MDYMDDMDDMDDKKSIFCRPVFPYGRKKENYTLSWFYYLDEKKTLFYPEHQIASINQLLSSFSFHTLFTESSCFYNKDMIIQLKVQLFSIKLVNLLHAYSSGFSRFPSNHITIEKLFIRCWLMKCLTWKRKPYTKRRIKSWNIY